MARIWPIPLIFAVFVCAQAQDSKQAQNQDRKTADSQQSQAPKYAEPEDEDENSKPSQVYVFNPLEAQSCVKIGNEYYSLGKYRPAIRRFREATKWNPQYAEAYLRLGEASEKIKDPAGAKKAYAKYLELSPDAKNSASIKKKIASLKD